MKALLKTGERVDDLQRDGLKIIQNSSCFSFGMDAVLLAHFSDLRLHDRVCDFGTGTGILPILMSANEPSTSFDAIEIQKGMADMAERSVLLNELQDRIRIHCGDLRDAPNCFGCGSMDVVVCNPPYGKMGGTIPSQSEENRLSRHEGDCSITEILRAASQILRRHGRLYTIFPANRMMELLGELRDFDLEPKRIRLVSSKISKPPYVFLLESIKEAKPMLLWEPNLVVYSENGTETPEMDRIYHRIAEQA